MVLKETISYYVNNGSAVYSVFLDATKAFDRIEYCKLFKLLLGRDLPPVFVRLLLNMYTGHVTCVLWNGIFSDRFSVYNGVKQGGVLSPVLFTFASILTVCYSAYHILRLDVILVLFMRVPWHMLMTLCCLLQLHLLCIVY